MDYFHESWSKAAGWINELNLENNDTELWADVEWTPSAESMIKDKELRYVSVEFSFEYKDNENQINYGPTLFGAGLTNRPFVKGMEPLTFNERKKKEYEMNLEQALAKNAELEKQVTQLKTDNESLTKELSTISGKVDELTKSLNEKDSKIQLSEKENQFNKMLAEGKVCEAQRAHFLSGDMVKFSENAQKTNLKPAGTEENPQPATGTAFEQITKLAKEHEQASKCSYAKAVSHILATRKDLAEQYQKESKGA